MPWGIAAAAVVGAYSANQQNKAAKEAAAQQQAGVEQAQQFSQEAADKSTAMLDPIVQQGQAAGQRSEPVLSEYARQGGAGRSNLQLAQGALVDMYGKPLDVNAFLDPSTDFAMKKGQEALERSASARGGVLSGAAFKDLADYAVGTAQQNYNNAAKLALDDRAQRTGMVGQFTGTANTQIGLGSDALNQDIATRNIGINTLGKQADIQSLQGTNNANLAMTSANVGAASTAAQKDVLGSAATSALGAYFSDEDLKKEIESVTDDEIDEFLSRLEPKMYEYTEEAKSKGAASGKQMGVMAQDMEKSKVGKALVSEDEDGDKEVDIPKSVSALIASTAALHKKVAKLEKGKK